MDALLDAAYPSRLLLRLRAPASVARQAQHLARDQSHACVLAATGHPPASAAPAAPRLPPRRSRPSHADRGTRPPQRWCGSAPYGERRRPARAQRTPRAAPPSASATAHTAHVPAATGRTWRVTSAQYSIICARGMLVRKGCLRAAHETPVLRRAPPQARLLVREGERSTAGAAAPRWCKPVRARRLPARVSLGVPGKSRRRSRAGCAAHAARLIQHRPLIGVLARDGHSGRRVGGAARLSRELRL